MADLEDSLICPVIILRRINVIKLTSNHLFYDLFIGDVFDRPGSNVCTISHDRDIVGDLADLSHLVADIYHRNTSGFQISDDPE